MPIKKPYFIPGQKGLRLLYITHLFMKKKKREKKVNNTPGFV